MKLARAQAGAAELPLGWFRDLKVGHDPKDPPEATLVLAAAAVLNGLRCDGEPLAGAHPGPAPSLQSIARQLCVHVGVVRRGVRHLLNVGAVHVEDGVRVHPEALRARWAVYRQRLHVTTEARQLRMRPKPLLLTALVAGQADRRGQLRLGIKFLQERTGFSRRAVLRALAAAKRRGAVHTWNVPPRWQLYLALGPSRNGARSASQGGTRRDDSPGIPADQGPAVPAGRRETSPAPIAKRHRPRRETAPTPSQSGTRTPDTSGVPPVSPPEVAAPRTGETRSAPAAEGEGSDLPNAPTNVRGVIDSWVKQHAKQMSFDTANAMHVAMVAMLIDSISPRPALIHDQRAFARERLSLARSVIRWCPWPDRLGRWLVRVHRWFRVKNLGAYLRRASEKGDPRTILESYSRRVLGRAAETRRDFTPQTEDALRGPRLDEITQLVARVSAELRVPDEDQRAHLRGELARYWKQQRPVPARMTLQKLVGNDCSDVGIARATEGILTLREARWLLGAA